ncbi:cofactor-independent phosphoglycerate mutase [Candidatus Galacturonibacter soehngenii]|uniref:Cofactor-independent phosphoglycerate mutase n=1 Tax=Candidatus Galacturonatibacter soehngenii TaxID=2307010 RepID=A0A7V7QIG3_9FIRM|nr:cofactor-independent phosphoglycerate mutase [Candidatus Galacturonibacter soehngenii]KAB1434542.1 cofactor-independent phosphoglycerate mutase [Candidatus Galacturonibacter soehngenii]MBA4688152.1 cofactor-independent phosphoglycerate mutase [Candidatus Galacturonibacter soehngenii]
MKYVIVLGDGMSDEPIKELGNQTPISFANTPKLDELSKKSEIGLVSTIPQGMKPGSDTANLSVLGYDPKSYYTGRSPLEALSIGVDMKDTDIAIRCNIVTLSEDDRPYEEKSIIDHSASEISTEEAAVLLEAVKKELSNEIFSYYLGISYRHLLIWDKGQVVELTPPHDILGKVIGQYLPQEELLKEMMIKSYDILVNHPINLARKEKGLHPANSIWFWGAGTKPALSSFEEKTHKKGAMISAVDLLKGIAVGAGMLNIEVEGADGTLETNYEGKAKAAVEVLTKQDYDFVYIHVEAPDEMGHQGSVEKKIKAIEYLDQRVIKIVAENLDALKVDYRMLVLPDHPTPICVRTHTSDPVPYMLYDSTNPQSRNWNYNEKEAKESGNYIAQGHTIIDYLFSK